MSKFSGIGHRALETAASLMHHAGDGMRGLAPSRNASIRKFFKQHDMMGAARRGSRAAGGFVKRHPVAVGAIAAVGAGLIGYAVFRRYKQKRGVVANTSADT